MSTVSATFLPVSDAAHNLPPGQPEVWRDTDRYADAAEQCSATGSSGVSLESANTESPLAMMHPVHRYIPPEITDEIISSLDSLGDKKSLCSCALVCKNWLPASRRRLFQIISFWGSPIGYDLFVSRVLHCEHMRSWLVHVRELTFGDFSLTRSDEVVTRPVITERGHGFVHDFSGLLPNLRYLYVDAVDWSGCPRHPSAYLTFFKQLRCLQVLSLHNCRFPSFYAFWRTIAALPSLGDLSLYDVTWPSATVRPPTFLRGLGYWPKLHALNLNFVTHDTKARVHTLLSWLSQTPSPSSIRRLTCYADYLTDNPAFLRAISASVTEISLSSTFMDDFNFREDMFSSFSQLESLQFSRVVQVGGGDSSEWGKLAVMLQNLPSRLRRLTIQARGLGNPVTMKSEGNYGMWDEGLELLDAVLDRDNFAKLECVRFKISMQIARSVDEKLARSTFSEALEEKLARLHARGIMKLDMDFCTYLAETTNREGAEN